MTLHCLPICEPSQWLVEFKTQEATDRMCAQRNKGALWGSKPSGTVLLNGRGWRVGKLSILSRWGLKGPLPRTGKAFSGEGITEGKLVL